MIVRGKRSPALSAFGQVVKPVLIAPMGTIEEEGGTKAGVKRKAFTTNNVSIPTETIREEVPTTSVPEQSNLPNESNPKPESEDVQEPAETPFMLGIPMSRNTKKGAEFGFEIPKNNETEEKVAPQQKKQALSVLSEKEESNFSENEMKVKTEPRDETSKLDSNEAKPKGNLENQEPEKVEPQKQDPPKQEPEKVEPQKQDPPKQEPEKVENPKEAPEQPHTNPSKEDAKNNAKKNDKQNEVVRKNPIPDYELVLQLNSNPSNTQTNIIQSEIKKPEPAKNTKNPFGNSPFSKEKPEEDNKKKEEIETKKQLELKKIEDNKKKLNDQKALLEAQKKGTEEKPNPFKQNPFNKPKEVPSIGEKKSPEPEVKEENRKPDEKKSEVSETNGANKEETKPEVVETDSVEGKDMAPGKKGLGLILNNKVKEVAAMEKKKKEEQEKINQLLEKEKERERLQEEKRAAQEKERAEAMKQEESSMKIIEEDAEVKETGTAEEFVKEDKPFCNITIFCKS